MKMKDNKTFYLGSDHAGYKLKEKIKDFLDESGYKYVDLGNTKLEPGDDYPDYAYKVAKKVAETNGMGILICDSGVGVCIAANKINGVRAVVGHNVRIAKMSRLHNNTNILCLGQDYISLDKAKKIIQTWIETDFSTENRHHRRLEKISRIENKET
jgi:ribose 5-phosphate isomerase B